MQIVYKNKWLQLFKCEWSKYDIVINIQLQFTKFVLPQV